MEAAGFSQAELARRVGVSQPTIFKLIHQSKKGSAHLHRIARELGTTPAYLSGETDDPQADAPDEPQLNREQRDLLAVFGVMGSADRAALLQLGRSAAAPKATDAAREVARLPENALAQMFEGLLMTMDRAAPLEEQARLLARRLSTGLEQLRDLLPEPATATDPKPRRRQPTPAHGSQP